MAARGRAREQRIDWRRVAVALRAKEPDELIRCPHCRAQGVVAYVAEHVLETHPTSPEARKIRRVVFGESA